LAYHYHYRLDYIDTLGLDEVKTLIDYVMPKQPHQNTKQKQPGQTDLERKLELFKKIKEGEARQK
jgi:hypothetical protein